MAAFTTQPLSSLCSIQRCNPASIRGIRLQPNLIWCKLLTKPCKGIQGTLYITLDLCCFRFIFPLFGLSSDSYSLDCANK